MSENNWGNFKETEGYNQEEQYMKSTEEKALSVFQITEKYLEQIDGLEPLDLGKWCYLIEGLPYGFFDTQEEAIAAELNWLD